MSTPPYQAGPCGAWERWGRVRNGVSESWRQPVIPHSQERERRALSCPITMPGSKAKHQERVPEVRRTEAGPGVARRPASLLRNEALGCTDL